MSQWVQASNQLRGLNTVGFGLGLGNVKIDGFMKGLECRLFRDRRCAFLFEAAPANPYYPGRFVAHAL